VQLPRISILMQSLKVIYPSYAHGPAKTKSGQFQANLRVWNDLLGCMIIPSQLLRFPRDLGLEKVLSFVVNDRLPLLLELELCLLGVEVKRDKPIVSRNIVCEAGSP
jgi:hypothetical protein